jgi:hypothetical protein
MHRAGLALAFALTVWAYQPALDAGFVYEDGATVSAAAPMPVWGVSRALTQASFRWQGPPRDPRPYHSVNLALHLAVGVGVGLVAASLGLSGPWATALFWLHPAATGAAASVSGRGDVLVTLGCLLAVGALVRGGRARWLVVPGVLLAAASKESGAAVAVLLVAAPWALQRRLTRLGLVAVSLAGLAAFLRLNTVWALWTSADRTLPLWMGEQMSMAWRIALNAAWPFSLAREYALPASPWVPALALASLPVLVWLVSRARETDPAVAFGGAWTLAALLPRLLVPTEPGNYLTLSQGYPLLVGLVVLGLGLAQAVYRRCDAVLLALFLPF